MKVQAQRYGLVVLLLAGIGMLWFKREVCTLDVAASWIQSLGSQGPFMFAGLYGLAPTFSLRGAVPPVAGEVLCRAILGMVLILMGTTISSMVACSLAHYLVSVWPAARITSLCVAISACSTRVASVLGVVSSRSTRIRQAE